MASKQDVYGLVEGVRLLGQELVEVRGEVAGLTGKLEEVAAVLRGAAVGLQELKAVGLEDRVDLLEVKLGVAKLGRAGVAMLTGLKDLEKPQWQLFIEIFGAGFHQPALAMFLVGAAAAKGDPWMMLLATFCSFFLSPYLTCLWVFCMLVVRCVWCQKRCLRSVGCGGTPPSKHSRNSTRNTSFLSRLFAKMPSPSSFSMPPIVSAFSVWRSQRSSASTTERDVESPNICSPGEGNSFGIALADLPANSTSTPVSCPVPVSPDLPPQSYFSFPTSSRLRDGKVHII